MKKTSILDISLAALGIAIISVCSFISITLTPSLVPFTLQTFAVCFISAVFGLKRGLYTVCGYILLGAVGVPVFAGFKSGFGALLGTTGGYIIGFIFTAVAVGFAADRFGRKIPVLFISMVIGIILCYAFGTMWFITVYTKNTGAITVGTALAWCVLPYLIPDAIKIVLAALLAQRIKPLLDKLN